MTPTGLGSSSNVSLWGPGETATVKGWGTTSSDGDASNVLLEVDVPIVSDADCNASMAGPITAPLMMCAGDLENGGIDACQGDSGGSLAVPDPEGGWLTVGVVSTGAGCGDVNRQVSTPRLPLSGRGSPRVSQVWTPDPGRDTQPWVRIVPPIHVRAATEFLTATVSSRWTSVRSTRAGRSRST